MEKSDQTRPGKIMEFEKRPKIMEKSWNFKRHWSWKIMEFCFEFLSATFEVFLCATRANRCPLMILHTGFSHCCETLAQLFKGGGHIKNKETYTFIIHVWMSFLFRMDHGKYMDNHGKIMEFHSGKWLETLSMLIHLVQRKGKSLSPSSSFPDP